MAAESSQPCDDVAHSGFIARGRTAAVEACVQAMRFTLPLRVPEASKFRDARHAQFGQSQSAKTVWYLDC